jgi:CDGSH-type Zn-finger protein/uncharacterized Fe-S cluster protein YjdI
VSKNEKVHRFEGEKIDVSWDARLCIHVQECTRAEGELFESGRKPWGDPDRGEPEYVAEVVRRCPSGALTYTRKDGGAEEAAAPRNVVTVANNGPLYAEGDLRIDGAPDDMPGLRYRAALCRCGASGNKPFCDGSHESSGFRDCGAIGETGSGEPKSEGGELRVELAKNGPLILTGHVALRSGAAREAWHGKKVALCRCGASDNKPFCDGTHKDAGFEAD